MTELNHTSWRISVEPEDGVPVPTRLGVLNSHLHVQGTTESSIMEASEKLTLSVPEAAQLLGISRALAYELVARCELPSIRLGHRFVVPRRALLEMLEGGGP